MLRAFTKRVLRSIGYRINNFLSDPGQVVHLSVDGLSRGTVLFGYVIDPFLLGQGAKVPNSHTHYGESLKIAEVFLEMGFCVDVISYLDHKFIPKKEYSIFLAARTNFQRISELLPDSCIKIVHLDTAHWMFNNAAVYGRCLDFQQRKGVTLRNFRQIEPNWAIEHADCATILGNDFTIGTYRYAQKPFYRVPVPTVNEYAWPINKDYFACRKHFLWFASSGLINRGLDILLEAFCEMPDCHLTICGPIDQEPDFVAAYHTELYGTSNIHTIGWVDVSDSEFIAIANRCAGLIYPSCAEGQSGAVLTCMQAGLIPIISRESGVDVGSFGVILPDCSVPAIKQAVQEMISLPSDQIRDRSRAAWEFARANHTQKRFAAEFRRVMEAILSAHR